LKEKIGLKNSWMIVSVIAVNIYRDEWFNCNIKITIIRN
jgi:hypothetical protein